MLIVTFASDLRHFQPLNTYRPLRYLFNIIMRSFITLVVLCFSGFAIAQNDSQTLQNMLQNDSSSLRMIFSYPDSSRQKVFSACTHPQGFTRLSEIQKTSAAAFRKLASVYSEKRQKQLWEISRYPNLVALILTNKDKSKEELKIVLKAYPEDTQSASLYFAKHHETLLEMEKIRLDFESRYIALVKEFPKEVQTSFATLLRDPELLSLLSEDMQTTVTIGDLFIRNPILLNRSADSVYSQTTKESGMEYADWKNGISKDTAMQKELKKVSKKYASEEDQTDDVYGTTSKRNVTTVLNTPAYPYWAGYPHWYSYPYWRPYPWWYNAGFYLDAGGSIIFIGMPSYGFGWWYYNHPHYYNRYHRTSYYFDHHYQGHPRSYGGFNNSIRNHSRYIQGGGQPRMSQGGGRRR